MQRNYLQLKKFLEQNFPQLRGKIYGGNYPPPEIAVYVSQMIGLLQLFGMTAIFMGDTIWSYVPLMNGVPPSWWSAVKENPAMAVGALFMSNTVSNSMTTTGAFEVELDGVTVFSKLETGRFPDGMEIIEALNNAGL